LVLSDWNRHAQLLVLKFKLLDGTRFPLFQRIDPLLNVKIFFSRVVVFVVVFTAQKFFLFLKALVFSGQAH